MTQAELDNALDRIHVIPVRISREGPLPKGNQAYDSIRQLPKTGFRVSPRELLHAIGCKTAALPMSERDECLKVAWLYARVLDLQAPNLAFQGNFGSDLQTARSQELGIGMMCLIAERHFGIPWDQLGSLPGQGKRFDYRGAAGGLDCIFESKGTSHRGTQSGQITDGLMKKAAHHRRGERFDVELIVSTHVGRENSTPQILIADPDKSSYRRLFERGDSRYFRLKHYCRALQFVGLPRSAFHLNLFARDYLAGNRSLYRTIIDEKMERGFLEPIHIGNDEFLGRWFYSWLPMESRRYGRLIKDFGTRNLEGARLSVFQGMRRDVYEAGLTEDPFSQPLIANDARKKYRHFLDSGVSVFPDGTVMIFRQTE